MFSIYYLQISICISWRWCVRQYLYLQVMLLDILILFYYLQFLHRNYSFCKLWWQLLSLISNENILLIFYLCFFFVNFWTSFGMFTTLRFLLIISLCLSFGQPVLCDPSQSWEYRICYCSLFKWPAHLRLLWVIISYMPESLNFSWMNLFGVCCHHLTFSLSCKWRIV